MTRGSVDHDLGNWKWKVILVLLPIFGFPQNKMRKYKKYQKQYLEEIQKIIGARKWCWNAEKMPKLVEEIQKLDSENPADKENSIWGRKVQNQMFMDSIKFYPRFNWIYGGFDCKKIDFLSQFRLLLEEIKGLGSNYNFEELIWSNQGLNRIKSHNYWSLMTN